MQIPYFLKATYAMQTTFVCKLWKLQSGLSDQDPRRGARGVEVGICKSVITESKSGRLIVKLPPSSCPLDLDPVVQIGVSIVCIRRWFA